MKGALDVSILVLVDAALRLNAMDIGDLETFLFQSLF